MTYPLDVLLVDDLSHMRRLMKGILRNMGFRSLYEAGDGKEALKVLENHDIGLIISDWNMPNMTGIEFLKAVRCMEKYKKTPFFMITAEATRENIIEAMQAGVNNYAVKPIQPHIVEDKIRKLMDTFKS